jgi:hypothetical protein
LGRCGEQGRHELLKALADRLVVKLCWQRGLRAGLYKRTKRPVFLAVMVAMQINSPSLWEFLTCVPCCARNWRHGEHRMASGDVVKEFAWQAPAAGGEEQQTMRHHAFMVRLACRYHPHLHNFPTVLLNCGAKLIKLFHFILIQFTDESNFKRCSRR